MSIRRLVATTALMALVAGVLAALGPGPAAIVAALRHPQRMADAAGPQALVIAGTAALAWLVWAWGLLGLALTTASALPGAVGAGARLALRVLLPAGARRGAAVLLGVGLGLSGAAAGGTAAAQPTVVGVAAAPARPGGAPAATPSGPPDWPVAPGRPADSPAPQAPDWPADRPDPHLVVRGDCLWTIAAGWLQQVRGSSPTDAEVAAAVRSWWRANAAVIGPDPDLILPGQVLIAPDPP